MARDREIVGAAMMGMPALMPFRMFASVVLLKRIRRCIHPSSGPLVAPGDDTEKRRWAATRDCTQTAQIAPRSPQPDDRQPVQDQVFARDDSSHCGASSMRPTLWSRSSAQRDTRGTRRAAARHRTRRGHRRRLTDLLPVRGTGRASHRAGRHPHVHARFVPRHAGARQATARRLGPVSARRRPG
jgi:hypothetical protein